MSLNTLVHFSRKYGSDPRYVLAGGGNTSAKENGVLYVKGSGSALATIEAENFVALDIPALLGLLSKEYPAGDAAREAAFLADVMAARLPGEENKRPSVETLLHAIFPQKYVLHLHPSLINGLTCAREGEKYAGKLLPQAVWVPACRPGYTLAALLAKALTPEVEIVLLQNHGIFYAADTEARLDELVALVDAAIGGAIDTSAAGADIDLLKNPLTPDQIVYCGVGDALPDTENARLLYADAQKIAAFAASFGGVLPMSAELTQFILGWEAESYRKKKV